jgi:glycosyltransferase involved in cell wall biosynthesis
MARNAREHEVIIALNGAYMEKAEELIATFSSVLPREDIRVWHPPRGAVPLLQDAPRLAFAETLRAQFLSSLQPDLVHVCSMLEDNDVVSCQPRQLQPFPVVATFYDLIPLLRHADFFGTSKVPSPHTRWYYRGIQELASCEGLLAISESSRNEAIDHLAFTPERVFNIRAGIVPQFHPMPLPADQRAELLARYGLSDAFIMFLAADTPNKNEAGLLAAYARLPKALQTKHQLFIAGQRDRHRLYQKAAELGIPAKSLVYTPFVDENDLQALYSACDLFVFPSRHEGFGLPAGEAMACGAPTIVSNTTSLPEVIGREDATFDPEDPDSIAACMRKVLENPAFKRSRPDALRGRRRPNGPGMRSRPSMKDDHAKVAHGSRALCRNASVSPSSRHCRRRTRVSPRTALRFCPASRATTTSRWSVRKKPRNTACGDFRDSHRKTSCRKPGASTVSFIKSAIRPFTATRSRPCCPTAQVWWYCMTHRCPI